MIVITWLTWLHSCRVLFVYIGVGILHRGCHSRPRSLALSNRGCWAALWFGGKGIWRGGGQKERREVGGRSGQATRKASVPPLLHLMQASRVARIPPSKVFGFSALSGHERMRQAQLLT
uniref:Putative secreted protein n=1 Tax=Ixodes ricinus TaxID=34613 RepID=A0A6B0UMP7_IXORI